MTTENPYYRVFAEGEFQPEVIVAKIVPSTREVSNDLQLILDKRWNNYQGIKRPSDKKPSRYRYEGLEIVDGVVEFKASPSISYKDCITWDFNLTEKYGQEAAPMPLMVAGLIETSDGKIVISKRNAHHDYKAEGLSGIGGAVNIKEDSGLDGSPDILRSLGREVEEETGVKLDEINPVLHGVILNPVSGTVNLAFMCTTSLTSEEIKKRRHDDENELLFVDIDLDTIQNLVLTRTNSFTVEILELLISMGRQKFGERWENETRVIFRLRGISYSEAIRRGSDVVEKLERKDSRKINNIFL